jgi:hypothetical protein
MSRVWEVNYMCRFMVELYMFFRGVVAVERMLAGWKCDGLVDGSVEYVPSNSVGDVMERERRAL